MHRIIVGRALTNYSSFSSSSLSALSRLRLSSSPSSSSIIPSTSLLSSIPSPPSSSPSRSMYVKFIPFDNKVNETAVVVSLGASRGVLINPYTLSTDGTLLPSHYDKIAFQFRVWPNSPDMTGFIFTNLQVHPDSQVKPHPIHGNREIFCNGIDRKYLFTQAKLLQSSLNAIQIEKQNALKSATTREQQQKIEKDYLIKTEEVRASNHGITFVKALQVHAAEMLYVNFPCCVVFNGEVNSSGVCFGILTRLRAATPNTILSFNDATRGLVPHGGSTHLLANLPYNVGIYLALTGFTLKGADAYRSGVFSYFFPNHGARSYLGILSDKFASHHLLVQTTFEVVSEQSVYDIGPFTLANKIPLINKLFAGKSLQEIINALELESKNNDNEENAKFASESLAAIRSASPLALSATFALLQYAKVCAPEDSINAEYRVLARLLSGTDYLNAEELILKGSAPRWSHSSIEQVTDAEIQSLLTPFPSIPKSDTTFEAGASFPSPRHQRHWITNTTL